MSPDTRDLITWTLGTALACGALIAAAVRLVLLPYLREHLVDPVREVKKQVTENSHSNPEPTVLDKIDDVRLQVGALARVIDGHLDSSDRNLDLIDRSLALVERRLDLLEGQEKRRQAGP
jgi:hypothetical protein